MASPKIDNALISVSDKTGLVELAQRLSAAGITLYASGGSRRHLEDAGIQVTEIAQYTGFPEMMDGRVKTLHPKVHGGILCRHDDPAHRAALDQHGMARFGLVVVNLYPFAQTVTDPDVAHDEAVEQIDVGGPTLVRAAAKNHEFVTIACHPAQYGEILRQIESTGSTTPKLRRELATAAFAHTAEYDATIARYFAGEIAAATQDAAVGEEFPPTVTLNVSRKMALRYGENPHQQAALYQFADAPSHVLVRAEQLHGKELSYNNLLDADSAWAAARHLPAPGVVVLKHNNPCGAATAATVGEATQKAWDGDATSAFGSILAFNIPVDAAAAEFLVGPNRFVEAIVAPGFTSEAVEILTTRPKWKANVRLLKVAAGNGTAGQQQWRQIDGGLLCQTADDRPDEETSWTVATESKPTESQLADLRFAWSICRFVKSNAITLVKDAALVGVGAGQMSRVDAVEIALRKAADRTHGSVLASDAFFPFDDSIRAAAAAGVVAVIQPGGSRRDAEVIAACNQHSLPMVFTARRHFRH